MRESDGNSPFGMKRSFLAAPRGVIVSTTPISTHVYQGFFWEHDLWKKPMARCQQAAICTNNDCLSLFSPVWASFLNPSSSLRSSSAGKRRCQLFGCKRGQRAPDRLSKQRAPVQQPSAKERSARREERQALVRRNCERSGALAAEERQSGQIVSGSLSRIRVCTTTPTMTAAAAASSAVPPGWFAGALPLRSAPMMVMRLVQIKGLQLVLLTGMVRAYLLTLSFTSLGRTL